jgi:hemoglobin
MMRTRLVGPVLLLLGVGATLQADDKPLERLELDKRIVKVVYESALAGTEIFNSGKVEQCFGLYQGTLMAVVPLLDHRPDLQKSVQLRMDKARSMKAAEGAHELRAALDEIQNTIAPGAKKSTLWERMGGEPTVRKVIKDFLIVAIEDPKVNLLRNGKVKLDAKGLQHLEQMLVELISVNTGGPLKYTGQEMKPAHAGMKITDSEFDAFLAVMETSLKKFKVADADVKELITLLASARKEIVEAKN